MRGRKIVNKYLVRSPFKPIVKTARFKRPSYTAWMLFKLPTLREATLQEVINVVKHECKVVCKNFPSPSVLRSGTIISLKEMSWESIVEDLKQRAPVLLSILIAAGTNVRGGQSRTPAPSTLAMAAAVLLKARSRNICKVQAVTGALLYAGHASKRVLKFMFIFVLCIYIDPSLFLLLHYRYIPD